MSTTQSTQPEVTVKDLVIAAGELGHAPSAVLPDAWATSTEIDRTLGEPWIIHSHEFVHERIYEVRIAHSFSRDDHGMVSWEQMDADGRGTPENFSTSVSDIPELIAALQAAQRAIEEAPRQLRREPSATAELMGRDA